MKTIYGNILDIERGVICHQVNCRRVANAGLARQIRERWPRWYESFRAARVRLGGVRLFCPAPVRLPDLWIADLYAQDGYGRDRRYTNYAALGAALFHLRETARADLPVYIPHGMGCGLGGGDWSVVRAIIADAYPDAVIVRPSGSSVLPYPDAQMESKP